MKLITGKHLDRRSLLKGFGAALALPMLDAMIPAGATATTIGSSTVPPTRLAFRLRSQRGDDWRLDSDGRWFGFRIYPYPQAA